MPDISSLPEEPGCYLFEDENGKVIYVGKAKNLKKRVASYFSSSPKNPKTMILVKNIRDVCFIITNTETGAFLLESNLIKKYRPRFNIQLKDSKRYAYILLTDEKFPRFVVARNRKEKGEYFGPFVSAEKRDRILKFTRMVFKIRTCKKLPKRPCLRYHIGLCGAPCTGNVSEQEYMESVRGARELLRGNASTLLGRMKREMKKRAEKQEYEQAQVLRDRIIALEALSERQVAERVKKYDQDIIAFAEDGKRVIFHVFNIYKGILLNRQEFEFEKIPDALSQFISRFYEKNPVPKEIIVQENVLDDALLSFLEKRAGRSVRLMVPKKGEKKALLDMARKNILAKEKRNEIALEGLRKALKLQDAPRIIECFDISHLHGTGTVASMVRFRDGEPEKSGYRRFKMRTVSGIDDFASVAEAVRRRYRRLLEENEEMPDLIVIDGGKGQLSSAVSEIRALGLNIPTIALAKKREEVFVPYLSFPLNLGKDEPSSLLLQRIRDEAHRFAVKYQRMLRGRK
ncbi:MAG: excinuclease ABC subunit C [Candidatus Micrarchaeota archaeon]|nr:excinuclease ABC subunit C [Candidatus Micrarchaeota archaeon]